jgi:hypothetical protein
MAANIRGDEMKMPEFLNGQSGAERTSDAFAIGETGFSFSARQRPTSTLAPWIFGESLPDAACHVLLGHGQFQNISGLLRVPTESDATGEIRAEWILGRASSGLVSIVVRDGATCDPTRLLNDIEFAIDEAKRYCATSVVVLVQEGRPKEGKACRAALQSAFATTDVQSDYLYASKLSTELPVWFASLSAVSQ